MKKNRTTRRGRRGASVKEESTEREQRVAQEIIEQFLRRHKATSVEEALAAAERSGLVSKPLDEYPLVGALGIPFYKRDIEKMEKGMQQGARRAPSSGRPRRTRSPRT